MKLLCNFLLASLLLGGTADARRPNVVVILSDDHRHDWMGHKGKAFMATPHDPYVTLSFRLADSDPKQPRREFPMAALHRGETVWRNNEDRKAAGEQSVPIFFNDRCNYPLPEKQELALFRCIAVPGMDRIAAEIVAPAGSLQPSP